MKLALSVLGASAIGAVALVSAAMAQPPARGPGGPGGFGLLLHDANGDGRVTRAEFDGAQKARFDDVDANKDGSATSDEFRTQRQAEVDEFRVRVTGERFDKLDADKNGQLSRAEFSTRPAAGDRDMRDDRRNAGRGPGPGGMGPAKRADVNADRNLTLGEFSARGAEAFTKADTNKDGVVTVTELQSLRLQRP